MKFFKDFIKQKSSINQAALAQVKQVFSEVVELKKLTMHIIL